MTKVLLATDKPFAKVAVEGIRGIIHDAGFELFILEKYKAQTDFIQAAADADAIIVRSDIADKGLLEEAKKLKIIVRAGAGYDNIDIKTARELGIVAMNTPGQNSNAVAELAIGMMIYLSRNLYDGSSGTELRGKKLGLHAYGNVSRYVAQIARGFGMEVFALDPFVSKKQMEIDGVHFIKKAEDLYSLCQYISLHMPYNKETHHIIGYELMSKMPKGATLINTARKEVICEDGLLKVMAERQDFKYGADVEPDIKAELELYKGRYFITPKKMGAQTEEANINAGLAAARQIVNFFKTGDTTYQINK